MRQFPSPLLCRFLRFPRPLRHQLRPSNAVFAHKPTQKQVWGSIILSWASDAHAPTRRQGPSFEPFQVHPNTQIHAPLLDESLDTCPGVYALATSTGFLRVHCQLAARRALPFCGADPKISRLLETTLFAYMEAGVHLANP